MTPDETPTRPADCATGPPLPLTSGTGQLRHPCVSGMTQGAACIVRALRLHEAATGRCNTEPERSG